MNGRTKTYRTLLCSAVLMLTTAVGHAQTADSLGRLVLQACSGRATCAEADFYSGTFEWKESLTSSMGSGGDRSYSSRTLDIVMTVAAGRVGCRGAVTERSERWSSGTQMEDRHALGSIAGPGLIRIEFSEGGMHSVGGDEVELDDDAPSYNITVVCASPTMTVTGGGERVITPSEPARWGSSYEVQTYDWLGDFAQRGLSGTATWNHPDSDPINGVSGSVTVIWNLTKR